MKANKQLENIAGIYKIQNMINGKLYIGKTQCFYKRCKQYMYTYKNPTKYINQHLLNSFNKYGLDNFEFLPIEILPLNEKLIAEKELFWINYHNSLNKDKGYNLRYDSSTGLIVHKSTSEKISARLKKEWASGARKEHSNKLKSNWKNNTLRKQQQSICLSNTLTKYLYRIYDLNWNYIETVNYKKLVELKLNNVLADFYKKQLDCVSFKGFIIGKHIANIKI